jgi:hypothetical protein
MTAICSHLDSIELTELPDEIAGCEECHAAAASPRHDVRDRDRLRRSRRDRPDG